MDVIKGAVENKLNKDSAPGDQFEASADTSVNQNVNEAASDVGVPQQDDGMLDKIVDSKVNSDIPFGNN